MNIILIVLFALAGVVLWAKNRALSVIAFIIAALLLIFATLVQLAINYISALR